MDFPLINLMAKSQEADLQRLTLKAASGRAGAVAAREAKQSIRHEQLRQACGR